MIPFSSERKLMAVFYGSGGGLRCSVKGAPPPHPRVELETGDCRRRDHDRRRVPRGARGRERSAGRRRPAGTRRRPGGSERCDRGVARQALTFAGFIGLADPPAAGVKETIARLRAAGLRTVMLTGDQRLTAEAVGRERRRAWCGRPQSRRPRARSPRAASDRDAVIGRTQAFSRVTPEHKLRIVSSLQSRGEVVAMLGDGINDAAALKKADVGVAMGRRGTDVAKEAAAIVLQDDRFETVAAAVEEGRVIFDNIRKFVFYLFSCNVAEVLVLLLAGVAGLPLPLAPLQLLWLNMVTDTFPALALAIEPGDVDVMRRPPRDPAGGDSLAGSFSFASCRYALLITFYARGVRVGDSSTHQTRAPTIAFMTLALAQIGHLGQRTEPWPCTAAPTRAGQSLCHRRRRHRRRASVVGGDV